MTKAGAFLLPLDFLVLCVSAMSGFIVTAVEKQYKVHRQWGSALIV